MSFKKFLLVTAAVFTLSGCSLYEGPPPARKKDFTQGNLGCLKDFSAQLVLYFDGKASAQDVNRIADCSIKSLQAFTELTRGETRDRFTAEEVRNFIQRYFLDDVVFTDGLLRELMRVKQALVGGKNTDFTRQDLTEAESLINVFRDISLRLLPSMPLSMDRVRKGSPEYVEAEAKAIADIGEIFGKRITEKDSTYSFEEMGRLFDEIVKAFPGARSGLGNSNGFLNVAGVLKEILVSPDRARGTVTAAEWRLIFQDGSRWLGVYLKFAHLQAGYPDMTRGAGRARLAQLLDESITLFERVVSRHCPKEEALPGGGCKIAPGIPFKLIIEMMDALEWDAKIGDVQFKKETLKLVLVPFFQHFFGGIDQSGTGRGATRLTFVHLSRLRSLIREWVDGARYVEGVYSKLLRSPSFGSEAIVSTKDILDVDLYDILRTTGGVTDSAVETANGLRATIASTHALIDKNTRGAIFDGKNKMRGRVYREIVRYTWLKPLLKMAVLGYMASGDLPARARNIEKNGLTLPEFTNLISEYWELLIDFKMVGPNNNRFKDAKKRFREASIFTQSSNGDEYISIEEGVQLVQYMFSASPLGGDIHDRAIQYCQPVGKPDDYGEPTVEPKCYREVAFDFSSHNQHVSDLWKQFPLMVRFYDGLKPEEQAEFRNSVEKSVRKPWLKPEDYFGSDESDSLPMVFHYIEGLFLRFDTGSFGSPGKPDGFIDQEEAKAAFPVFRNALNELSGGGLDDSKLRSAFTYLLAKGTTPVVGWRHLLDSADFLWWHLWKPNFKANRLHVVGIFAMISTMPSAEEPVPQPTPSPTPTPGSTWR
jgi:hypothetical protein